MNRALDLDHVAVINRDLAAAGQIYERLGFELTRVSSHQGPVPPHGRVERWGTGNRCAMFRRGYLELLGVTDPERYKTHLEARLRRYEGLHLIAFGSGNCSRDLQQMGEHGVSVAEPITLTREVPWGTQTRPARFSIAYLDDEDYPEADFIVIEHHSPDVLWQPSLMAHPNGSVSLESVTVCPQDTDAFMQRMTGVLGSATGGRFVLTGGTLEVVAASAITARFGEAACGPPHPSVVAVCIGVSDLELTAQWLQRKSVTMFRGEDGVIRVPARESAGAIVEFKQVDTG